MLYRLPPSTLPLNLEPRSLRARTHHAEPERFRTANQFPKTENMKNQHTIAPDITGLKKFSRTADRELSPIFAGRHEEGERVLEQIEHCAERHHEGLSTAGRTMLVTGPPGMGKSAFLQRMAEHVPQYYGTTQVIPVAVNLNPLRTEQDLNQQIADAIKKEKSPTRVILEALASTLSGNMMKNLMEAMKIPERLTDMLRTIGEQVMQHTKTVPVMCLMIDEIQTATEANGSILRQLHTQDFSPPILPVFAGLSNASSVLYDIGISRYSNKAHIPLGLLPQKDARQAVYQLFERYRVQGNDENKEALANLIAKKSNGFPQHLHVGLASAALILAESGGVLSDNSRQFAGQMAQAERIGTIERKNFYASKMNGLLDTYGHTVLDLIYQTQKKGQHINQKQLIDWAYLSMQRRNKFQQKPTHEEAVALVKQVHQRGVLELTPERRAEVPIPSMRTWLMGEYARHCGYNAPKNTQNSGISR